MKRKIYKLLSSAKIVLFALALTIFSGSVYSQTYTLNYTGSVQTVTLPAGNYEIRCWGADGGAGGTTTAFTGTAGVGGFSKGEYSVATTTTLYIYVGGVGQSTNTAGASMISAAGGWNGGGGGRNGASNNYYRGGGGGGTDVRTTQNTVYANRIIVAGGGGGAGGSSGTPLTWVGSGGNGGGTLGQDGVLAGSQTAHNGKGGTQSTGGAGGVNGVNLGVAGSFGLAGDGGGTGNTFPAGGGGGGWYGGGGGATQGGGGGGGSSYIGGVTSATTIMFGQTGFVTNPDVTGNGRVVITSLCNLAMVNSAGPGPICSGGSATLTSNGVSGYSWNTGATTPSIVVSPTITTQYTLTAMSPQNCTTNAVVTVSVINGPPTVTAVTTSSAVCAGGAMILTASGAATYTWTNGVTNAVSYTPVATNIYTVTGQNACGTGTATVGVTVNTSPNVQALVNSSIACSGASVTFTSSGNAASYVWSSGIVSGTPYFPTATGNYTLIGSSNGCNSVSVVGVTVIVTPTIAPIVTPTAICLGQTATLSAVGATGYTWNPGTNPNTSTIAVSPGASTNYSVVRSNGICSSTMAVNLVINPLPLVVPSASPSQICAGDGVNLTVVGPITNTWMPGGFTSANFTLFPNSPTCYTVTGSNGNCTATTAICVTVNPTPPITINTPSSTICEGQSVTLTAGGALTYTWLASSSNSIAETVSPPTTTLITVSGSNSFGCTASATQLILVNAAPNMSLTNSVPYLCLGDIAVLSIANPSPNITYSWNNGPVGLSNPVTPTVTTSYTATGQDNGTGCSASNTITVAVNISTFVINAPSAICKGQTATLSVTGSATSYSWNINGGIIAPSVTVAPVINTIYNVKGINGNCESNIAITLTVNPLPNVTATAAKSQICKFEIASVTAAGASTYTWDTNSNATTLTFTLSVTTTYTVTGTDSKGCSKATTVTQYVATCIGIEDIGLQEINVDFYPNPTTNSFFIRSDIKMTLHLVNALGQQIRMIQMPENEKQEITVGLLPPGIYFVQGQANGHKVNKKLIIER